MKKIKIKKKIRKNDNTKEKEKLSKDILKKEKEIKEKPKKEKAKKEKVKKEMVKKEKVKKENIHVENETHDTDKKKKEKHSITTFEFIFCLFSLLFAIGVGLYFGGRSFYYYSVQNAKKVETANTLNGLVFSNNPLNQEGDGLHQNTDGYYFKGKIENNYVKFANRIFRIISINNDDSVKLVSNDLVASFFWGNDTDYNNSNLKIWLSDEKYGIYNATIPSKEHFLDKTSYTIDVLNEDKVETGEEKYSDYVTTLSITDYNLAGGKNSYLYDGKMYYLLGTNADNEVLYVNEDGSILSCDGLEGYGLKSVITLKKNTPVKGGDGTKDNPYVIEQGDKYNYVDAYVKLGEDMWKVSHDVMGDVIRLYKVGYVTINGQDYNAPYSNKSCLFDVGNNQHIAHYMNGSYYNSLSYKDYIVDSALNLGEFSEDTDYKYMNIYMNIVYNHIGLLNIFDYVSENQLNNYYNLNTTSSVGGIQYVKYSNGFIEEVDVKEARFFVPVISIKRDSINVNSGDGSLLNVFDYVSENQLNNYYNLNTTSDLGGIQYVKYINGFIEEVDVKEARLFVPVISIRRDSININSGDGSLLNPYTVG